MQFDSPRFGFGQSTVKQFKDLGQSITVSPLLTRQVLPLSFCLVLLSALLLRSIIPSFFVVLHTRSHRYE